MDDPLGTVAGLSSNTVWAIAAFITAVTAHKLQPALSKWLESRAEHRAVTSAERLNGKLVQAVQDALKNSVSFQALVAKNIEGSVLASQVRGLQTWRTTHEASADAARDRMARLEAALTAFMQAQTDSNARLDRHFEKLQAKLEEWLEDGRDWRHEVEDQIRDIDRKLAEKKRD